MKELIKKLEKKFDIETIENTAIKCFVDNNNLGFIFSNELINQKIQNYNEDCYKIIQKNLQINYLVFLNHLFVDSFVLFYSNLHYSFEFFGLLIHLRI